MNLRKKIVNTSLTAVVAMSMFYGMAVEVYADSSIPFTKVESGSSAPVGNATVDFYQDLSKIFSVKTDSNGKLDPKTITSHNKYNASGVVTENGTLNLPDGTYSYVESNAPAGFLRNPRPYAFSVVSGVATDLNLENRKFPQNKGQLIIKTTDEKTTKAISGVVIDITQKDSSGKYKLVATVTTDTDGLVMGTFTRGENSEIAQVEYTEGSLLLAPGTYRITEKSVADGYKKFSNNYDKTVSNQATSVLELKHTPTNTQKRTGVKIRVVDKSKNPVSGRAIQVYKYNSNKSSADLIFDGRTGDNGYFDNTKVETGSSYLNTDGVLEVDAGNYYYILKGVAGAKKHDFTVKDGVVDNEVFELTVSNTASNGKSSQTSSAKPAASSSSSSKLAKTGSIDSSLVQPIGLGLVAVGAFVASRRRK